MSQQPAHVPVLLEDVLDYLQPAPGGQYIDGTVGAGGHSRGLLEASAPDGRVLAFDRDPEALAYAGMQLADYGDRVTFVHASFAAMGEIAPAHGFHLVNGIVLDLGLSSRQLDEPARGFSFRHDAPLDMRFDQTKGRTAAELVNNSSERELADILWRYGEERRSRPIARAIVAARPIETTGQLAEIVSQEARGRRSRIHPATRIFQALRIAVNQELEMLEEGLKAGVELLKPGGRMAVISFHSLEDRIVKHAFREWSRDCICPPSQPVCTCDHQALVRVVTRKVVQPEPEEVERNPRSRSARLRVAERVMSRE